MQKSNYSDDSYAARFLSGVTVIPDDTRIFHRPGFQYDEAAVLGKPVFADDQLSLNLTHWSGAPGRLTIRPARENVLRIQYGAPGAAFQETSPMLEPAPEEHPAAEFSDDAQLLSYRFNGYRLELDKSPFCLRIYNPKNELIFESETERLVGLFTAPPMGLRHAPVAGGGPTTGPQTAAFLSWRIRTQDRCFGLGEKFNKFEKTGTRATIWEADTCGSNTTDMSYKAVPVIFSTAGWGLLLHSSYRSQWELGSFSYATGALLVEEPQLDLFLILAPTLKEQVSAYTALTGRPGMPPKWAFGAWMSRAAYRNRAEMWEVAERLRAEEIPCDTFNIDPTWMPHGYYNDIGVEVCNFEWNARDWDDPVDLFAQFNGLGFGICLWINPYFSEDSAAYAEARQQGYLVKTSNGAPARLEFGLAAGIIDLTNPAARPGGRQSWWTCWRKGQRCSR
jgi:alpha-D-xyloside xylohydrolase